MLQKFDNKFYVLFRKLKNVTFNKFCIQQIKSELQKVIANYIQQRCRTLICISAVITATTAQEEAEEEDQVDCALISCVA